MSEGWEDAYVKDEGAKLDGCYYVAAPDFKKMQISETVLQSSLAYELLVPQKQDFPSVEDALLYVKKQYETQQRTASIPLSEAVDVIFDYAKEINHPLAKKAGEKREKHLSAIEKES